MEYTVSKLARISRGQPQDAAILRRNWTAFTHKDKL